MQLHMQVGGPICGRKVHISENTQITQVHFWDIILQTGDEVYATHVKQQLTVGNLACHHDAVQIQGLSLHLPN